jgi:hypothetical protein
LDLLASSIAWLSGGSVPAAHLALNWHH